MTRSVLLFLITAWMAAGAPTNGNYENLLKTDNEKSGVTVLPELSQNSIKNADPSNNEDLENDFQNTREIEAWISQDANQESPTNSENKSDEDLVESNQKTKMDSKEKKLKKGRKHKALFIDYPFIPQLSGIQDFDTYENIGSEERSQAGSIGGGGGGRKNFHESNIYYIRLPPTPYMFVPGLGYVSQPPTYSTGPIRPQIGHVRPQVNHQYRPAHAVYNPPLNEINPFINLPIDFVSNGKPTSVYQWQSPGYQPSKRPETEITTLDKGPYFFNGRPHSIYLLRPDGPPPSVHQSLQYPDYQDNSYY